MPSITIREIDNTRGGNTVLDTDVVYVPGFVSVNLNDWGEIAGSTDRKKAIEKAKSAAAPKNTPILCTNIRDFEAYFGNKPAIFTGIDSGLKDDYNEAIYREIKYSDITDGDGDIIFDSKSYGANSIFVDHNGYDRSYIYAKELLKLGIPVLYESVNKCLFSDEVEAIAFKGSTVYYEQKVDKDVDFEQVEEGSTFNSNTTYFEAVTDNGVTVYNQLYGLTKFETGVTYYTKNETTTTSYFKTEDETPDKTKNYYLKVGSKYNLAGDEAFDVTSIDAPTTLTVDDIKTLYNGDNTEDNGLINMFERLLNKNEYNVKYLTSGGYPTFEVSGLYDAMQTTASNRADCVAIVDHTNYAERALINSGSVYEAVEEWGKNLGIDGDKVAMFTPWITINSTVVKGNNEITMPPSYGYLSALAKSIQTNANWLAIAGAARGQIPYLDLNKPLNTSKKLTNAIAEQNYQNRDGVSLNAITYINPFGYRIWGNRTLKDNSIAGDLTATSFLNIRNMVSDIKKVVYSACKRYMFEQNSDILWANFKADIEPTLEKMRTGAGLSGYKIIKIDTSAKAKLEAVIKLYPLYAVEDFDITVTMEDDGIKVS